MMKVATRKRKLLVRRKPYLQSRKIRRTWISWDPVTPSMSLNDWRGLVEFIHQETFNALAIDESTLLKVSAHSTATETAAHIFDAMAGPSRLAQCGVSRQ